MGCCPFFRSKVKVSDIASSNLEPSEMSNSQPLKNITVSAPHPTIKIQIPSEQIRNSTQIDLKLPNPKSPAQVQSNLDIAISISRQNSYQGSMRSSDEMKGPKVILIQHSNIRQSIIYRWQLPSFKVEELFLPINYDKLFK